MPLKRDLYPADWEVISFRVREAAGWRCEECGQDCQQHGESLIDFAKRILHTSQPDFGFVGHHTFKQFFSKPQRWVLTAAHLDQNPANNERDNLKALCCACHLKYDSTSQQRAVREFVGLERNNQLSLFSPLGLRDKL